MLRFYGSNFVAAIHNLGLARGFLVFAGAEPDNGFGFHETKARERFARSIAELEEEITKLPVSSTLVAQVGRLKALEAKNPPLEDLLARIDEISSNMQSELAEHLFLCVPRADKLIFLAPEQNYWGKTVVDSFPDAVPDMRKCSQCIALTMWTASVFHAMRAVQHGLHRLADRLQVTFNRDIDVLNWNEILQGIDKKLRDIANQPKTPSRDSELQFASSASSHFFGIKEAWRNYVMHGRSTYDEEAARLIADNVRAILKALA